MELLTNFIFYLGFTAMFIIKALMWITLVLGFIFSLGWLIEQKVWGKVVAFTIVWILLSIVAMLGGIAQ